MPKVKSHVLSDSESDDNDASNRYDDSESTSSQDSGLKNSRNSGAVSQGKGKGKGNQKPSKTKSSKTNMSKTNMSKPLKQPKRGKPQLKRTASAYDPDHGTAFEYTLQPRGTSGLAKRRRRRALSLSVDALDATELAALDNTCLYYTTVDQTVLKMA